MKIKISISIVIVLLLSLLFYQKETFMAWYEEKDASKYYSSLEKKDGGDSQKIIYLTFDDGPSNLIADRVLDILKVYDINATFFIVGSKIQGREAVVERMYKEGHTIGLHTYTHKYKNIYASEASFIKEMKQTAEETEKLLKIKPTAIRFPFGSKPHLNQKFLEKLHGENMKVYDWNGSLSDGLKPNTSPEKLYKEAIQTSSKFSKIILLAHCSHDNKNTCEALPKIIEYYKGLGYEFKAITEDTPEYYFRVKR